MRKFKITHPEIEDKVIEAQNSWEALGKLEESLTKEEKRRLDNKQITAMAFGAELTCEEVSLVPYKGSDDLPWKIEKALEFVREHEEISIRLLQDLESLYNISQAYTSIEIELDDMDSRKGRHNDINKHLERSRPFLRGGYGELEVAMRQVLIIFEEIVEEMA